MGNRIMRLRRGRPFWPTVFVAFGVILFCGLAWTIFWHFAARQSVASLAAWIAREKAYDRNWSCPNWEISGFPFAIKIACSHPKFVGNIFGRHYSGALGGFVAKAIINDPNDVTIKIASPFAVVSDDKTINLSLSWEELNIVLAGLPRDLAGVAIAGRSVRLQGYAPRLARLDSRASKMVTTLRRAANRADHVIDFQLALSGASAAAIDGFLGDTAPADVTAEGEVTQADFDPAKTLALSLDQWRTAGGHIDIDSLSVARAATKLAAKGTLSLDRAHQIEGRLDTKCLGFEPLLRRLGVNPALINAGSLLASLFGQGGTQGGGPQPLHLPVGFIGGRLTIGPVITSIRVPAVY